MLNFILILLVVFNLFVSTCCFAKDYSYMGSQDEKFKNLFYEALELEDKNNFQDAIKLLDEALKINPEQMQALGELCICYLTIENAEKVKETALKGLAVAQKIYNKDNIGRFYHNLAAYYKMKEQHEQAIKYFKLALYNKPYYTADYDALAYSYYKIKNYEKAIECYRKNNREDEITTIKNTQLSEIPLKKHEYLSVKYMLDENDKLLESECKKILELDSENISGLIGLARVEVNRNNYSEAIKYGEKILPLLDKKENEQCHFYYPYLYANVLNNSYSQLENYDKSTNYFKLYLIATHTKDATEALEKGNVKLALSHYMEALKPDSEIETKYVPYNYMALDGIIELLFDLKQFDEAKKYIQKGIKICKSENNTKKLTDYTFLVGRYYDYLEQYDNAIKYYDMAFIKSNDLDKKYLYKYLTGCCYITLGNLKNALEQFNECNKLVDKGAEDSKDINSQIIYYTNLFDENSDISKAEKHYKLAVELFNKEQYDNALKHAEISIKYRPQYIPTISVLEQSLFKLGREEEGLNTAVDGINIAMRDHDSSVLDILHYDVGNYYARQNNYEKALKSYAMAAICNPYDKDYHYNIGYCYKKLKQYKKAIDAFEKGLMLDPDDKGMQNHLKDCKRLLND